MDTTFRHSPEMGEISGFGGGYEQCCQDMLEAGCKWLQERQPTDLAGHSYENITGIFVADSDDAKALEKVILDASKGEATGAMHHTVMARLFYINKNGWAKYCDELKAHEAKESE